MQHHLMLMTPVDSQRVAVKNNDKMNMNYSSITIDAFNVCV